VEASRPRVLVFSANQVDRPLDLDREWRAIRDSLGHNVEVKHLPAARADELVADLREHQPLIVHFIGHGSPQGLELAYGRGDYRPASGSSLQSLFADRGVELVVLSSCFSSTQAHHLAASVQAVVGTPEALEDESSASFSSAFYRSLSRGTALADALRDGRDAVQLQHGSDTFELVGNGKWKLPAPPGPTYRTAPAPGSSTETAQVPELLPEFGPDPRYGERRRTAINRGSLIALVTGGASWLNVAPSAAQPVLAFMAVGMGLYAIVFQLKHLHRWATPILGLLLAALVSAATVELWRTSNDAVFRVETAPFAPGTEDLASVCSNNGTVLAFEDHNVDGRVHLVTADQKTVVVDGHEPSATGGRLASVAADDPQRLEIRSLPSGEIVRRYAFDGSIASPTIDRAGDDVVVVQSNAGDSQLVLATGEGPSFDWAPIHNPQATIGEAAIAPSGDRVAYVEGRSLYVADLPAMTSVTRIASGQISGSAWSPDERELAYAQTVDGQSVVMVTSLVDGSNRRVTSPSPSFNDRHPSWHPTCDVLAFVRSGPQGVDIAFVALTDLEVTLLALAGGQSSPSFGTHASSG
jgi:hypothetical protein